MENHESQLMAHLFEIVKERIDKIDKGEIQGEFLM